MVKLAPARITDDSHPEENVAELLAMLTIILREASLLPEADFSSSLNRAFERGLGHKLSPGRPYDELAAWFTTDAALGTKSSLYNTPWEGRNGWFRAHDELRWEDGQGPTYSRDRADELLQTRYLNVARSLRITVPMLGSFEKFRGTVEALREQGWLDWHILAAIVNIVMNYRFPVDDNDLLSEETNKEMIETMSRPEKATADPVPIGFSRPMRWTKIGNYPCCLF